MPEGGRIVCTASLAGLMEIVDDPIYGATKHAVVGFVRSVATDARGTRDRDQRRSAPASRTRRCSRRDTGTVP